MNRVPKLPPPSRQPAGDMVNHPPHYNAHPKGIECIDVIEDCGSPLLANVIKYLWRVSWGSKGRDLEDLKKARWYLDREIARREIAAHMIPDPEPVDLLLPPFAD